MSTTKAKKRYHYRAGLAVEDEAVRSGLLKTRRGMCGCPPCSPPRLKLRQVYAEARLRLCGVDALPSEAEAPRRPHADPGACRVIRVGRRERGARGKVCRGPDGRQGSLLATPSKARSATRPKRSTSLLATSLELGFFVVKVRGQANFKSPSPQPLPNDVSFRLCMMLLFTFPEATNTGPGFNRGSGGGARGGG